MKMTNTAAAVAAAMTMGAGAAWAVPAVSGVQMTQRANSRTVDITYTLSGEEAIVTLGVETNGVSIPDSAVTLLSGDVCKVVQTGTRSIIWNAGEDWPENSVTNAKARVTAWSTNTPPQVVVVDLSKGTAATAQNPYPVNYYVSVDALPFGVSNAVYKTTRLVLRRIPAGAFNMGTNIVAVTLTRDFYAGVYEVTQFQWNKVMGSWPAHFNNVSCRWTRPVEQVPYDSIRGSGALNGGGWPTNGAVSASSFMGLLRARTGISGFDLPTEAQWEYACRAGTSTYFSDGLGTPANVDSNEQMNVLGRYKYNGGGPSTTAASVGLSNGTAEVGSYLPNPWQLYDMHGNVNEWCLDWNGATLPGGGIDPSGPSNGTQRVLRSGSWCDAAYKASSAFRGSGTPNTVWLNYGFRAVINLP